MKVEALLPFALIASAFVLPDPETFEALSVQNEKSASWSLLDKLKNPSRVLNELDDKFSAAVQHTKHDVEETVDSIRDTVVRYSSDFRSAFAPQAWLDHLEDSHPPPPPPPPPPHSPHSPPPPPPPPHSPHPPHSPDHPCPGHPPHNHKPEKTIYEIIAGSEYTTKFIAAVNRFPDLVELLNSTKDTSTLFVPIDRAWDKIPAGAPTPSDETLKDILSYHILTDLYPAGRVLHSRTLPSSLKNPAMGNTFQRLSTQIGFRGLTLNFYSRVIALDVFATNGVIHGIDSILLPPPKAIEIISLLPGAFSTLELGLIKTGLYPEFNNTDLHEGGTLFAPPNLAFQLLGPRINAFLFSDAGKGYLKALLLYHVGRNVTLYSDAIYWGHSSSSVAENLPKGLYHVTLPSFLTGKDLNIDIGRFGRLVNVRVNGYVDATVLDGVAEDGVIHVIPVVLIPPATLGGRAEIASDLSLEELIERLEPFVGRDNVDEWEL